MERTATPILPGYLPILIICLLGTIASSLVIFNVPILATTISVIAIGLVTAVAARHMFRLARHNSALRAEVIESVQALCESEQRRDQFLSMLSHELRNPLGPLRNALYILRLRGSDPQTVEMVRGVMERQVVHMSRLIDDLVDVSRLTRGLVELQRNTLDLSAVVAEVVRDQQLAFDKAGVRLQVLFPPYRLHVDGDSVRLSQVLENLLENTLKFTSREDSVTVTLSADSDRGIAKLSVSDTGVGIAPEVLETLFESFSQADSSLDRAKGGLGLGLTLVKGLMELHGGTVRAKSEGKNKGAEFELCLPLKEIALLSEVPPEPVSDLLDTRNCGEATACAKHRILIIEDNRDAAESLRVVLEESDCEVVVAYSGPDGVRAALSRKPEAIVCDIGLPGMDGFEVATSIRSKEPNTKLIAVTGYGGDGNRRKALAAGFDDHLVKPVDPQVLLEKLNILPSIKPVVH